MAVGRAGRPARRLRRRKRFCRRRVGRDLLPASLPRDLLLLAVPSLCGDRAPSPGPPVAVRHTLSSFPRTVPRRWACSPNPERSRAAGAGWRQDAGLRGMGPVFIGLALVQTDVSFYFELPESRSFLSIVSPGRPPGETSDKRVGAPGSWAGSNPLCPSIRPSLEQPPGGQARA